MIAWVIGHKKFALTDVIVVIVLSGVVSDPTLFKFLLWIISIYVDMIALVLITLRPKEDEVAFFRTLKTEGYDLFIVVDDNKFPCVSDDVITYIQYNNSDCVSTGFTTANFIIRRNGPTGWDKAIRFFCENTKYDNVWFLENDVFIPSTTTIVDIDKKYGDADILSASNRINTKGGTHWHWRFAKGNVALPWACSMVCAIRVSRKLLAAVFDYVKSHKKLLFIEFMFHTLALHKSLEVKSIPELSSIVWSRAWNISDITKRNLYHPIKNSAAQNEYRRAIHGTDKDVITINVKKNVYNSIPSVIRRIAF
jgi:hypothetical protein